MKNAAAVSLGKLAKGKPKNYTASELQLRRVRLAAVRSKRWKKKGGA